MTSTSSQPTYLRRQQAAAYVQDTYGFPCSPQWLARLAVIGGGPAFRKASRFPLYDRADLDVWAHSKIGPRVQSTADLSAAQSGARRIINKRPARRATAGRAKESNPV
jgi:hypothetical protein